MTAFKIILGLLVFAIGFIWILAICAMSKKCPECNRNLQEDGKCPECK